MISIKVDASRANLKLSRIDQQTRTALRGVIVQLTQALASMVRGKLSGGVLKLRSGRLRGSIQSQLIENTTAIYGRVSTSGVIYAAIHEFGGVIKHPGSSKFQAWQGAGGWVYTHMTKPHDIPMPERSYLRSSLADMQAEVVERMTSAVRSAARAA